MPEYAKYYNLHYLQIILKGVIIFTYCYNSALILIENSEKNIYIPCLMHTILTAEYPEIKKKFPYVEIMTGNFFFHLKPNLPYSLTYVSIYY